jgi:hypothetical protein
MNFRERRFFRSVPAYKFDIFYSNVIIFLTETFLREKLPEAAPAPECSFRADSLNSRSWAEITNGALEGGNRCCIPAVIPLRFVSSAAGLPVAVRCFTAACFCAVRKRKMRRFQGIFLSVR